MAVGLDERAHTRWQQEKRSLILGAWVPLPAGSGRDQQAGRDAQIFSPPLRGSTQFGGGRDERDLPAPGGPMRIIRTPSVGLATPVWRSSSFSTRASRPETTSRNRWSSESMTPMFAEGKPEERAGPRQALVGGTRDGEE